MIARNCVWMLWLELSWSFSASGLQLALPDRNGDPGHLHDEGCTTSVSETKASHLESRMALFEEDEEDQEDGTVNGVEEEELTLNDEDSETWGDTHAVESSLTRGGPKAATFWGDNLQVSYNDESSLAGLPAGAVDKLYQPETVMSRLIVEEEQIVARIDDQIQKNLADALAEAQVQPRPLIRIMRYLQTREVILRFRRRAGKMDRTSCKTNQTPSIMHPSGSTSHLSTR